MALGHGPNLELPKTKQIADLFTFLSLQFSRSAMKSTGFHEIHLIS